MNRKRTYLLLSLFLVCNFVSAIPVSSQVGACNMPLTIAPVKAPFNMPQLVRPKFPHRTENILQGGAQEGVLCTKIIQKAIDDLNRRGGGTVIIPPGNWLSGRITLKSNINLHLEEGAELHFSGEIKDYLPVVRTRNEGIELYSLGAMIYADKAHHIALTGKGKLIGPEKDCEIYTRHALETVIEKYIPENSKPTDRIYDGNNGKTVFLPMFFSPMECTDVLVEGVTFEKTLFWNVVPVYCNRVIIRGITVQSFGTPRGDGIDIDSSRNILIEYTTLDCGDDCFTIKAGRGEDGLRVNRPSENIVVRYCLAKRGPGAITFGSETAGVIRNVYVHDCVFENTQNGFYFKTRRNRGGGGEKLYFERIRLVSPSNVFRWDMLGSVLYVGELAQRLPALPVTRLTPFYRHISVKDIIVEDSQQLIKATGIPESPLSDVSIVNMTAKCKNMLILQDVDGFVIENSTIRAENAERVMVGERDVEMVNVEVR